MDVHRELNRLNDTPFVATENQTNDNVTLLPIELTNTTGTYLQNLYDDCLLEIFSSNSLTPVDLCSLAETCARFKLIIQRVFPKEFGIHFFDYLVVEYGGVYAFESNNYYGDEFTLQDVERVLENFGPRLSTLRTDRHLEVVRMVKKYCGDLKLKCLDIYKLKSIEGVRAQLNSIFQRLLKLSIYKCDLLIVSSELNCDSLTELEFVKSSGCVAIMKHTFPNLERLTWNRSCIYTSSTDNESFFWLNFFGRHRNLKAITLSGASIGNSELLRVISSSCNELEELVLGDSIDKKNSIDLSNLKRMAKLKVLVVNFGYQKYNLYTPLFQAAKLLEVVEIICMDDLSVPIFDILSQLRNLCELHLRCCDFNRVPWTMLTQLRRVYLCLSHSDFHGPDLVNIIRQLTNLEMLEHDTYEKDFKLSEDDLNEIFKVVERRDHVLALKCKCSFKLVKKCREHQKVRLVKQND